MISFGNSIDLKGLINLSEVGQLTGGERRGNRVFEGDDGDAAERPHVCLS